MECRFFKEGRCKFGKHCHNKHVKTSGLFAPPPWVLSAYSSKDASFSAETYTFEEVRLSFYQSHRQGPAPIASHFMTWNNALSLCYSRITAEMKRVEEPGVQVKGEDLTIDIRDPKNFSYFVQPVPYTANIEQIANTPIHAPRRNAQIPALDPLIMRTEPAAPPTAPASAGLPPPIQNHSYNHNANISDAIAPPPRALSGRAPRDEQSHGEAYKIGEIPRNPPNY